MARGEKKEIISLDQLFEDLQEVAGEREDINQIAEDILVKVFLLSGESDDLARALIERGVDSESMVRIAVKSDWNDLELCRLLDNLRLNDSHKIIPVMKMLCEQKLLDDDRIADILETIFHDKKVVAVLRGIGWENKKILEILSRLWRDDGMLRPDRAVFA